MHDLAIVILAGGDASRFPGKLEHRIGATTLLETVYDNMRGDIPVCIAARGGFSATLEQRLNCPIVIDRWPGRGPLGALVTAFGTLDAQRVFAVAGDAPCVTRAVLHALAAQWQAGDDAVVPEHDGQIEPLAALYERVAVLREGWAAMERGDYALRRLIAKMNARYVALAAGFFVNINTEADLARIGARMPKGLA